MGWVKQLLLENYYKMLYYYLEQFQNNNHFQYQLSSVKHFYNSHHRKKSNYHKVQGVLWYLSICAYTLQENHPRYTHFDLSLEDTAGKFLADKLLLAN